MYILPWHKPNKSFLLKICVSSLTVISLTIMKNNIQKLYGLEKKHNKNFRVISTKWNLNRSHCNASKFMSNETFLCVLFVKMRSIHTPLLYLKWKLHNVYSAKFSYKPPASLTSYHPLIVAHRNRISYQTQLSWVSLAGSERCF